MSALLAFDTPAHRYAPPPAESPEPDTWARELAWEHERVVRAFGQSIFDLYEED